MAITASFNAGVLSIHGDSLANSIVVSRSKAGEILINGGAVAISGGPATVANTTSIQAFGMGDDDALRIDNSRGALPPVLLFGGSENDTLTGSTGGDWLLGQDDDDLLTGGAGDDTLFGGAGADTLIGGTGGDQIFGESGDDLMVWNPGDGTDLFEGGADFDTAQVNGTSGAEVFSVTANGTRVRFDRLNPEPSSLDIGTTEHLVVNAGGGNDFFSATGNLAALIAITVDGGAGNDTLLGSNGSDTLIGGTGNDFIDGQQGNDLALLGSGNDIFQWDPGDGSDTVEGEAGTDTLLFNGSAGSEIFNVAANGTGVLFSRNLGNIVMDLNEVETIKVSALGGADSITVNHLAGTGVGLVAVDLAGTLGGTAGDGQTDSVTVNGTDAADTLKVMLSGGAVTVTGLAAKVTVVHAEATDQLIVDGGDGNDSISGAALPAGHVTLHLLGGAGNDTIIGSAGGDLLSGQDDQDLLYGGAGNDTLFGGAGNDTLIGGTGGDQIFGESGDDLMVWNPGDGTDLFEGGADFDTAQVNGTSGAEVFSVTANGTRVRFDRLNPEPSSLDIGTTEHLVVNAGGGNDFFSATGNLAALIAITVDGGAGNDTLLGSNGSDTLIGGTGNDFIDGQQGNDLALLGSGNDIFQWDPGDGSDTVEGEAGTDTLLFNGSAGSEIFNVAANGTGVLFSRNLGNIVMDLDGIEVIKVNALGGTDSVVVNDLAGTGVGLVAVDLAGTLGGTAGDGQLDSVTVHGSSANDTLKVMLSGGAVTVTGLAAKVTVVHAEATDQLIVDGGDGNDSISGAALPAGHMTLHLLGGAGNDTIIGSAGGDLLSGQDDQDLLYGGAGNDTLFGGAGNDTLIGGTDDDQVFGESGDDLMVWNPGDGTDLFEGGADFDTAQVNGTSGAEVFSVTANGARVRFDRLNPEPSSLDIGTTEHLVVNAGGGNDFFSATGNLAALIAITVDGGAGNDTLLGSNGSDTLIGGTGNDFIDGQQGNDLALLGSGNDIFQWDPGDGSDTVEGGAGTDTLLFNGSAGSEIFNVAADGGRVDLFRNLGNIVMDLNEVEVIKVNALGGTDSVVVNDLAGTGVGLVAVDLAGTLGGTAGDGQLDSVTVHGNSANDTLKVMLSGGAVTVTGLAAKVTVVHAEATDQLIVDGGDGNDSISGAALPAGHVTLHLLGGAGNDTIIGSAGGDLLFGQDDDDLLLAGAGDDTLIGGAGADTLIGGAGSNIFVYESILEAGDLIEGFDATGADSIDLDGLLDGLGIADADRAGRVSVQQAGSGEDALVSVDTNGDQTFDTVIATVTNVTGNLDQNDLNLGTLV